MNETEIDIAIAEACGWTDIKYHWVYYSDNGNDGCNMLTGKCGDTRKEVPSYTTDLNAMHEAEKVLRKVMNPSDTDSIIGDRMHNYAEHLNYAIDATARQRAEAFLKTLGRWKETT